MKLSSYLHQAKISDDTFAASIGVNRSTVSRLRRTNQRPKQQTLIAIVKATGGDVTANDFWLGDMTLPTQDEAA